MREPLKRFVASTPASTVLVRYRGSDYSAPTTYGPSDVIVKGFVDQVIITCDGQEIAGHKRSYERGAFVCDPFHYLALIEQKPNALDQARPLQGWALPDQFEHPRRHMAHGENHRNLAVVNGGDSWL